MNRSDAMILARALRTVRSVRIRADRRIADHILDLVVNEIADTLDDGRPGWDAALFRTQSNPDTGQFAFEAEWPE